MKRHYKLTALALAIIMAISLPACKTGGTESAAGNSSGSSGSPAPGSVTLTLAFNVNPSEDDTWPQVEKLLDEFKTQHPEVGKIDYVTATNRTEEQGVTMMKSGTLEDVTFIPSSTAISNLPDYFAPLGDASQLGEKYYYGDYNSTGGKSYAMTIGVVYEGLLYNQRLMDKYSSGKVPKNYDDLVALCDTLKINGITPFWTNAGSKWPLRFWDSLAESISENPDYANSLTKTKAPWADGTPLNKSLTFLSTLCSKGQVEADTVTDQWENSRRAMAKGELAFMLTGSWALPQVKAVATELGQNPDDIQFAPFPYKNNVSADNPLYVKVAQDLFMGVNKSSKNVDLAKDLLFFFCERIGPIRGMNSIVKEGGSVVEDLKGMASLDYIKLYNTPARTPDLEKMTSNSQIDVMMSGTYLAANIIEPSISGEGPQFDKLNAEWAKNFS